MIFRRTGRNEPGRASRSDHGTAGLAASGSGPSVEMTFFTEAERANAHPAAWAEIGFPGRPIS